MIMTSQDHASHLLRVWQERRAQGIPPELRLEQDNKSKPDYRREEQLVASIMGEM